MEIGLESAMPTYAGGLGILAGDTIRSAADLKVPLVAVTLLHRKGYFVQRLDATGKQTELPEEWSVTDFLTERPERVSLTLSGRTVHVRAFSYRVRGVSGFEVPVHYLDTDLPENAESDRRITDSLYGGDSRNRFLQEAVLGIGGVRMLRALGYPHVERFHLNEGHSSLLTLELLRERVGSLGKAVPQDDLDAVRSQCVFTTHTPVPAGHDRFPLSLVTEVLGEQPILEQNNLLFEGELNLTYLALKFSTYVNGVAKKHGQVSRQLFGGGYDIDSITNGVHAASWTSAPFQALFDRYVPGWRSDNFSLRYALRIPLREIWNAHLEAKRALFELVHRETGVEMDVETLTLGFARRAATYKRADLLFHTIDRLKHLTANVGRLQLVYAGKAHPRSEDGKELIKRIYSFRESLKDQVKLVYLENYDMKLGKIITTGVDVWLNTPQAPLEASGTSGMKAALNGIPSLSILDGWWLEGHIEGVTGWSIGDTPRSDAEVDTRDADAAALYDKLEKTVVPLYYQSWEQFMEVMRSSIALNGSFFTTERMVHEYVLKAYFRENSTRIV